VKQETLAQTGIVNRKYYIICVGNRRFVLGFERFFVEKCGKLEYLRSSNYVRSGKM